jgi:hypothetical protein
MNNGSRMKQTCIELERQESDIWIPEKGQAYAQSRIP